MWGMGSDCLMGMEFEFYEMTEVWRWMMVMITRRCECTNTLKMIKMIAFILGHL